MLGVAVILATSITNLSTLEAITSLFSDASGKASLIVISSNVDDTGFSEGMLRRVTDTEGIARAVPSLHVWTQLADDATEMQLDFFDLGASGLSLYGIDPEVDRETREYKIAEGEFLSDDLNAYEIVLVQDFAQEKQITLGSDIEVYTPSGLERLRVVGLMSQEGPGRLNNGDFGVIPLGAAQDIFERIGELDQIDIVVQPGRDNTVSLEQLKAELRSTLGEKYTVAFPASQSKRMTQMLDTYQLGLSFFSVVALFVGTFLIYNVFSMTVAERTREIGLLRAVGMTRRQIMRQIMTEAVILGLLGSVIGILFGLLLSWGLIRAMEYLLSQEVRAVRMPLNGFLQSMFVGIVITLLAASLPARKASQITPLEALRVRADTGEGWIIRRGWIIGALLMISSYLILFQAPLSPTLRYQLGQAAIVFLFIGATLLIPITIGIWDRLTKPLIRLIYGNEGGLGSSNVQRAKMRTTLTATALMVGIAMILGIRGMAGAFRYDIENWMESYIGGDLFAYSSLPMRADLGERLEAIDGVEAVAAVRYLDVNRLLVGEEDEKLTFMAFDPHNYQQVTSIVFANQPSDPGAVISQLGDGDTVFISSILADKYDLGQGDTIRLETRRGAQDFKIAAIVVDFFNEGLVVQGSWKDLRRYFRLNDVTVFFIKIDPDADVKQVQEQIDGQYGERRHLTVDTNQTLKREVVQGTNETFAMFDILSYIAIVVAAFGVINTLTMNVSERTREIGALRGVGMTRRQVSKMILAEAAMIGLIGGAFGLIFGLFVAKVFLMGASEISGYDVTYVLPVQGIIISVLIALAISQLAAIWPARRASHLRIVEAIQYE